MTVTGVRPELVPPELLERVVRFFDPELVILFGSRARGEAGADSDYDLLVVVSDRTPVEKRRLRAGYEARAGWSGAVDIIPCTRSGFERQRAVVGTLAEIAVHDGIVVHVRD
jgi:predicted nucleotidyltransferase